MSAIGWRVFLTFYIIQTLFKTPVTLSYVSFESVRLYHRVVGSVRINQTRIDKQLCAINQTSLHTLPHNTLKKALKGFDTPAGSSFT